MSRHNAEYIVYDNNKGDEIIAIGTIKECAEQLGKTYANIKCMMANERRGLVKKYTFYRMED